MTHGTMGFRWESWRMRCGSPSPTNQDQLGRSDEARGFLRARGITGQSAERWQLGFAPPRWDGLVNSLRGQGVADELLVEAGLAGRARTGRVYDRMRGRIIFPVHDAQGAPRGVAGRLITGAGPKYLNSPQTTLYRKSELLYGLHHAADAIAGQGHAVVVEGYTDAITAHQAGFDNTVATGGTAVTEHHLIDQTLRRHDFREVEARVRALHRVAPLVDWYCGSEDRRDVINYLAARLDRDEDYIRRALTEAPLTRYRRQNRDMTRSLI